MMRFFTRWKTKRVALGIGCVALLALLGCRVKLPPPYYSEPHFHAYAYGEKISFGLGGDSHRFTLGGWSHVEQDFTWTDGIGASLIFFAPRTPRELTLSMRLKPMLHPPELTMQPVRVYMNGRKIADWEVTEEKVYTAPVPYSFVAARENAVVGRPNLRDSVVIVIDLLIPKAQFPALLSDTPDWRRLGVACSQLVMREGLVHVKPPPVLEASAGGERGSYTLSTAVLFGGGQNGDLYKTTGWNRAEGQCTWTGKEPAAMEFILKPPKEMVTLTLRANGNIRPPNLLVQPTQVYANGHLVAELSIDVFADYTAEIPAKFIGADGKLKVEFVSKRAISPQELGVNSDARQLGICCYELTLADADE